MKFRSNRKFLYLCLPIALLALGILGSIPVHAVTGNFIIAAQPTTTCITTGFCKAGNPATTFPSGQGGANIVQLNATGGFTGTITLTTSVTPVTGLAAQCSPASVTIGPANGTSTCSYSSTTPNSYSVTISGSNGTVTHSVTVAVTVISFSMSLTPASVTFNSATTGSGTLTLVDSGFNETVNLTASTVPATGLTVTIAHPSVILNTKTATTNSTGVIFSSSTPNVYNVTFSGSSPNGPAVKVAAIVNVQGYTVSSNPNVFTRVSWGGSATSTVTVTGLTGFSGSVNLFTLPIVGLTSAFSPASVTVSAGTSATSTMTLTLGTPSPTNDTLIVSGNSTVAGGVHQMQVTTNILVQVVGTFCLADASNFALTNTCPATPYQFNGPFPSSPQTGATQVRVGVFAAGTAAIQGAAVIIQTNSSVLQPWNSAFGLDLTGSIIPGAGVFIHCVNDVIKGGPACSPQGVPTAGHQTVEASVTGSGANPSTPNNATGLLFTLIFNITGNSPASGALTAISFVGGCTGHATSVPGGICVTASSGSTIPTPENVVAGTFANAVPLNIPWIAITSTVHTITVPKSTAGTPLTITATAENGYAAPGTFFSYTDLVSYSSVVTTGFTAPPTASCSTAGLNCNVTLTVNTATAGTYTLTVQGTYQSQDPVTGNFQTLVGTDIIVVNIQDFTFGFTPTCTTTTACINFAPGGFAVGTSTVTSLGGIHGVLTVTGVCSVTLTLVVNNVACGSLAATFATFTLNPGATVSTPLNFTGGTSGLSGHKALFILTWKLNTTAVTHAGPTDTALINDFSFSATTPAAIITGSTGTNSLSLASLGGTGTLTTCTTTCGFFGTVTFATAITPATGLTATCASVTLTVAGSATGSCTFSATAPGTYTVVITASGGQPAGSIHHAATITVTVNGDYQLSASPNPVTIAGIGNTSNSTITITFTGGMTGSVSLTDAVFQNGSPFTGLTCSQTPTSVTGNGTSVLSCKATATGSDIVEVTGTFTGTGGTVTRMVNVTYNVTTQVQGFKLTASPTSSTVVFGQQATSTITVTETGGFTGTVNFSETNTPTTGLSCTFTPTSFALTNTVTSGTTTLACSSTAITTFTLTVSGSSTGPPAASNSTTVTFTFNKASTTTSLASSANPSVFGQSVTFTATVAVVAPGAGTPTGAVNFLDGTTVIGSGTLSTTSPFVATFSTSSLAVGTHSITATYVGDTNFSGSTSGAVSQVVGKASTTTTLTSSVNPSVFGQSVTFTATVAPVAPGAGSPTGTVNFLDGTTVIGTGTLSTTSPFVATFSTGSLSVATHSITATYVGDTNFSTSTSGAVSQVVGKASTSTSLTSGTNPSVFGQSVDFSATVTVTAPGAGTPTGAVNILDGTTVIGSCTLPTTSPFTCNFITSSLTVGTHSITATYVGDTNFSTSTSGAVSQVVNKASTTTTLTSSVNPSVFGQSVTFTATVAVTAPGAGTPAGTVNFLDGTTVIGTGTLSTTSPFTATFSTTSLTVGTHSITAQYLGNTNFSGSTSGIVSQVVGKANTTTTLASSVNPSVFGQSVTFTATVAPVAPGAGSPTGTVNFLDGTTVIGTGTLSTTSPFTATFSTGSLTVGTHSITATYVGDTNFSTSTSGAVSQVVGKASTTTALTSSVNPSVFGQSVTFTATVAPVAPGAGAPTGTVNFLDGTTVIGTGTLSTTSPFVATFSTSSLSVATHSITATYVGDTNFSTSTSGAVSQVVGKASTTTTLTSSVNPSVFGQSVTFTATVAPVAPGAGAPTGTVNFLDGTTVIGTGTLSTTSPFTASFSTSSLAAGTHSITATYVGDTNFSTSTSGAVSQVVNKASTATSLTSSLNPSVFGQSVTFTATVTVTAPGAGTPAGTVNFLDGTTVIGSGTLSTTSPFIATFSTTSLTAGTHSITAQYLGNANFSGSTSGIVSQVVGKANTTTTLASSVNPSVFGQSVTFTATVAPVAPGAGSPTGTVNFLDGTTVIGTGTLSTTSPFVATFSTSSLAVATHSITATYVGDTNFSTSTSGAVSQVVGKASTTTTLTSSVNPSVFGQSVTFSATVAAVAPGAGAPTGTVNFLDGTTVIGTGTLSTTSPFVATFSTSTLSVGTHSITATYVGDTNFSGSTSGAVSQVVGKASTTTTLASSVNPSVFGQSVTFTATVASVAPGAGAPTGTVNFLDGTTVIGTGTLSTTSPFVATFSTSSLSVATHSITATYVGDTNFSTSTSGAVSQVVGKASTTTTLTSSVNPSVFGQSVTFTATVAPVAPGAGSPTGTVNFLDGTTVIGTGTLSTTSPFVATFSTSSLSVATHSITATYVGDTNFSTSTSGAVSQVVNKASTSTTLVSGTNPSVFGQSVTFTATVTVTAPGAGTPAGTVNFLDGTTVIGSGTLSTTSPFIATFSTSSLAVGTHSITAQYLGNTNFSGSTSGAVSQVVGKASTTTTLTSSVNPSVFGQSVTFTATVAPVAPGAGAPTGTVNFLDGTTVIGTGTLSTTSPFVATFSTGSLTVGTHSITATYVGDTNFSTSTSGAVSQVVGKASTTTTLTSSVNPSVFGQSVTFTATVAPVAPGAGAPTGTVNFLDGTTVIGTGTLSTTSPFTATFSTSSLSVSTHSITATYVGDTNFSGSTSGTVSQVVGKASTTTTLTSSVNPSVFGQSVTFTATVAPVAPGAGAPTGTVNFLDGTTVIGTGTLSTTSPFIATFSTTSLAVGTHSITATYVGDANFSTSTSGAVSQVVGKASTTTTLASSVNPSVFGQSVTFTATVAPVAPGAGSPTGTVNFLDGTTVIGTGTLSTTSPFVATFSTSSLSVATHSITATYVGDTNFSTSTSGAVSQVVGKASTTTTLTSSVNPSVFGQSVTFTATVAAVSPGAGSPTGTVNFLDGTTVIGTGTLSTTSPFTATFSTSSLSVATHSITATYVGDTNFSTSTSGAVSQVVNKASTTTTLTSSVNPSVFGQSVTFTATVAVVSPGTGTPAGTVNFLDGTTVIGSGTLSTTSPFTATFSTTSLAVGTHSITAQYLGNTNFSGSTSGAVSQVVGKASTTTTLASSVNPSVFGQSVTFTATVAPVAPGAGAPTGTVNFLDGTTVIGTGTLSTTSPFIATFSTSSLSVATHSITATYVGDTNFSTSTSGAVSQVVGKASTTTTLASSVNPSVFGQSVTFTATVAAVSPGAGSPTGTVNFLDGTTVIGTGTLSTTSPFIATFSTSSLSVATHSITATYVGDTNFSTSTSGAVSQVVGKASTSTTVSSSNNPSTFGQSVTFTATVAPLAPGAGAPTGTVNFLDGTTVIGTGTLSTTSPFTATFSTTSLTVGTHSITATYVGDTNFSGSTSGTVSQAVNPVTGVTIATFIQNASNVNVTSVVLGTIVHDTAGLHGQTATAGGTVTYSFWSTGTCAGTKTAAGTVTVTNGAIPNSNAITPTAVGSFSFNATYSGDTNNNKASSSCETLTVTQATTTTALVSSANPSVFGQSVTFTATVTPSTTVANPTGTVNFLDGTTVIGSGTLSTTSPFIATFSTSSLAVGTHSITAQYLGNTNFSGSTSSPVSQVVGKASTTTTLTSSVNPSVFGQSVTFTATVAPVAPGAGAPTGTVNFLDGTTVIGTGTLSTTSPFIATFSTSSLSVATHSITATYVGDTNFSTSTSGAVSQVVGKASTTTTLTSSVNPSVFGQSVTFTATVAPVAPGAGSPTGTVNFLDGTTVIGTGTLSTTSPFTATFSTGSLSVGTHSITATYVGDTNFSTSTSGTVSQVVGKASTTTTLASSVNPSVFGQSVTFTATVAVVSPGAGSPTGTVNFLDGTTVIGTGTLSTTSPFIATFSTTSLAVGTHSITATYVGDTNFSTSTSGAVSQVVGKASTTTTLASSVNPSVFGQSVTFTATVAAVSPGAGSPTGTVNFLDGTTVIGTGTLSTTSPFVATFSTGSLTVGTHSITATYVGDTNFSTSTSGAVSQVVGKASTTTTLTSSVNPSVFGQSVTFTATVAAVSPGAGSPTGTVNFLDGTTVIGTGTLSTTSPFIATFSTTSLAVGTHSITATYVGDTNFSTSTSGAVSQVVGKASTSTTVSSSNNPSTFGQSVTFTATVTVTAPGAGSPTGTVNFLDGTTVIGTGTLSTTSPFTATFSTSSLAVGTHSITATYVGDTNFSTSTSAPLTQTVNALTGVTVNTFIQTSSNVNSTSVVLGTTVHDTASLHGQTPTAGGTVTYSFWNTGTCTGTATAAGTVTVTNGAIPNSNSITPATAGSFSFNATYSGDTNNNKASSSCESLTVSKATTTTALVSSANPSVFGQSVTFTATVTPSTTVANPSGTVNFLDGTTVIGSGTLSTTSPFVATFSTASLTVGTHSITATYVGDTNFSGSTSGTVSQVVGKASTTTTLASSVNPSVFGQSVTFTATVAPVAPGAGSPSGTVNFLDGTTVIGSGTLSTTSPFSATFSTSTLAVGTHSITATYVGDTNFSGSTSGAVSQVVGKAATTTTLTSSVNPSVFGQSVTFTATVAPVAPGAGAPTGTVNFLDGTTVIGTGTLSTTSPFTATFSTSSLAVGTHSITATYVGDTNFSTSTSGAVSQVVGKASTSTTVSSSNNPSTFGQSVTFTATVTVTAPGAGTPTGAVNFLDGTTVIGTGTLSTTSPFTATFSTTSLAVGTHSITATYVGDANFSTSTSAPLTQTVNAVTGVTIVTFIQNSSNVNSTSVVLGTSVHDTASLHGQTANAGGTVTYSFWNTGTCAGTKTAAGTVTVTNGAVPNSNSITPATAGSFSFNATYSGDTNNNKASSSCESLTVSKATTTTALVSSANPSVFGQSVTFTATVTPSTTVANPTGAVNFLDGTTVIGSGTLSTTSPFTATFSTSTLAVGTHSITATYVGDTNFSGSTSGAVSQVVGKASTTTTLTSSVNPSVFGQSVTFTATVAPIAPGAGSPTGTVNFLDGTTVIGTGTLSTTSPFVATFSTSSLSVTTHSITATYVGDTNFSTSTSGAVSQVVNKAGSTVTLTSSVNPSVFGQGVTFTATISAVSPGAGTPTGAVNFLDGTAVIGSGTVSATAPFTATFSTSSLAVGTHSITAVYVGDSNFATSTSGAVSQVVNKASTTTSLTSSQNPSTVGQSVTFTATVTVTAPGAGTPTGTVTFLNGTVTMGTSPLSPTGTATFSATFTHSGSFSITAQYSGDTSFLGSTSAAITQTVSGLVGITISTIIQNSSNTAVSSVVLGTTVHDTATLARQTATAGGTVTYSFWNTGTCTGTKTVAGTVTVTNGVVPNSNSVTPSTVGSYSFNATYSGDANNSGASSTCETLTVTQATTTTSVASSANPSAFGQSVTFTATVTPSTTVANPSGTVNFLDGTTVIGSGTLSATSPFTATFSTSTLAVGAHSITATYVGNTNFFGSTSAAISQIVNKGTTTTTLTSSVNPSVFGQSVTFTATVTAVAPSAGTPTGTVNFLDGTTSIGTGTVSGGMATFTTSSLSVGSHSITASYVGDTNFSPSTSPAVSQVVNMASTTTTIASSANPSVFGQSVTFTATVTVTAPGAGTPTGMVTFFDGTTSIGTGTVSGGMATFTTSSLSVGSHSITASYGGDGSFNGSTSAALTQNVTDFEITASPTSVKVNAGDTATVTVTITSLNGFTGTVTITPHPSTGLTVTPNSATVTGGSGTATFTVSSPTPANYTVTFTGSSGPLSHTSNSVAVQVVDFQIFASPTMVNINPGQTANSTITVSPINGFTGTVTLTAAVSPTTGLSCTLSPTSVTGGSGTSTLSCTSGANSAGTFTVTVTGTNGNLLHTANVTVNVQDFTITNSGTITVTQGACSTGTITINSQGGFSGTVSLNSTASAGITASLNPTSVTMSGSSVLTVCAAASTAPGTSYMVVVTGTSGTLSHSTTVPVTVVIAQQGCPHDTNPNTCVPPVLSQMSWKHRLSIAKTGGTQTWKFGILNNNNDTIFVQAVIMGTDGSGVNGFTLSTPVTALTPGQNNVGETLSVTLPASDIGDTFQWNIVIMWGTTSSSLPNTSTANNGVPISGSFTVLP